MVVFKFNPAETGLRKTLREYEEIALRYIWSLDEEGAGSGKTWEHVNKELSEGKSISRASVIFYLNRMVDEGVLGYRSRGEFVAEAARRLLMEMRAFKKEQTPQSRP